MDARSWILNHWLHEYILGEYQYLCFPPFGMIWPTTNKIEKDEEKALIIVPMWLKQIWFTRALELVTATPVIIKSRHLYLPGTSKQHPLCPKLNLMAIHCSKNNHQQIEFRKQLLKSSLQPGHHRLNASTNQYSKMGRILLWKEYQYHADRWNKCHSFLQKNMSEVCLLIICADICTEELFTTSYTSC